MGAGEKNYTKRNYLHIVCIAITQNSYPYSLLKIDNLSKTFVISYI